MDGVLVLSWCLPLGVSTPGILLLSVLSREGPVLVPFTEPGGLLLRISWGTKILLQKAGREASFITQVTSLANEARVLSEGSVQMSLLLSSPSPAGMDLSVQILQMPLQISLKFSEVKSCWWRLTESGFGCSRHLLTVCWVVLAARSCDQL